jgi:hypothetical protein
MSLYDVRVLDSDAPSYRHIPPAQVLHKAEHEKKLKYNPICERRHSSFTPLCMSVDGLMGTEMSVFLKRLSDILSTKWERPYNTTLCWVRTKISFALIRATDLCIRGSCTKGRGLNNEDRLGINEHHFNVM